jgi:putative nucleotidyltransferase with HDIG domain
MPDVEVLRAAVTESLPEIEEIYDPILREKVTEVWTRALSESEFERIEDIPASGNPDTPPIQGGTQTDHIRGVTRLALAMSEVLLDMFPAIDLNRDLLIAAALCHDVGKPYEFSPRNQERWSSAPSQAGKPALRHTLYGAHLCLSVGLPEEVAHVAGAHSPEGQFVVRSLICNIVHHADYAFWDTLRSAGLLKTQET